MTEAGEIGAPMYDRVGGLGVGVGLGLGALGGLVGHASSADSERFRIGGAKTRVETLPIT